MKTYIALLRGINVSGQKKIIMADLRAYLEELGFQDIQTYIQSGNIVFKSENYSLKNLELLIKNKIQEKYGFEVPIIILAPQELVKAIKNNPFSTDKSKDPKQFYIVFLQDKPQQEYVEKLKEVDYSPEELVFDDKIIYFYAAFGAGRTKLNNNFFENKLKVRASSRNWRTVSKLVELSQS